MTNTVLSFPIPPYQNVPIHAEYFRPSRFVISAITLGVTSTVTTTVNHNYVIGNNVRLIVSALNGARQFNGQEGLVIAIPNPNQVTLNISSVKYDPFITASPASASQIVAIGDINSGAINDDGRRYSKPYIPGSFRNISPL